MLYWCFLFFFKQKTAYEMRTSDWSSDVCSSDLDRARQRERIRRDDAHVRLDIHEARRIKRLRIDDGGVDVGEDLELARATHVVAIARRAVRDQLVALAQLDQIGRASCRERVGQYV